LGSGAACGSIYLTKGFETLLRTRLGTSESILDNPGVLKSAVDMFENMIKCEFDPDDPYGEYNIPVAGVPDSLKGSNTGRAGYLKFSTFVPTLPC
jgi:hypothetical protein